MRFIRAALGVMALASLAGIALAQGPGMWGGPGLGYGPGGMMGYGPGGIMGYSPGGMMGYGPGGMMGYGPGHYGGHGMMWGGGPGMMSFGWEMQNALGLSDDQRKKVDAIHDELESKNWEIVGKMRVEMAKLRELMNADPLDKAALDAAYKRLNDLRQQRFDAHLAARDQMAAALTKEQREQLKHFGPW